MRRFLSASCLVALLLSGGCGGGDDKPVGKGRIVLREAIPEGPAYTEGSATRLHLVDAGGEVVFDGTVNVESVFKPIFSRTLPAGRYALSSVQLPCSAACPAVDRPDDRSRCTVRFEVRHAETTPVMLVLRPRRRGRVVACQAGRPPRAEYQQQLLRLLRLSEPLDGLWTEMVVRPLSRARCRRVIQRFFRAASRLVGETGAITPPADAERPHEHWLAAARVSMVKVLRAYFAVQNGTLSCGSQLNKRLYNLPSNRRADQAMQDLEAAGYHLGLG